MKLLELAILGSEDIEPEMTKYARTIVYDAYAVSDRRTHRLMAEGSGITTYRYRGNEIKTTRCFCRERYGKVYDVEEYKKWGRLEDIGECETKRGWAGRNPLTNENNILDFLGGYNCRHLAFATTN